MRCFAFLLENSNQVHYFGVTSLSDVDLPSQNLLIELSEEEYKQLDRTKTYYASNGKLTTVAPPNNYSKLDDSNNWVDDTDKKQVILKSSIAAERRWRDTRISSVSWMFDRHTQQMFLDPTKTTLTIDQIKELLEYVQALRDWPESADFPNEDKRPVPPAFVN